MIVQCTPENVTLLIENARNRKLVYLRIEKADNDLAMDYSLLEDISDKEERQNIETVLKDSMRTTIDLINKLTQLSTIVERKIEPMSYKLLFDCLGNKNVPVFSFSSMLPNGAFDMPQKAVSDINWDTVFIGRLDEEVPELYVKKSSKKYAPVTYKELVEILKKNK